MQPHTHRGREVRRALPGQESLTLFAAAFLALTLVTDGAYVQTMILMWKDFSAWLLFAGLICGGVAVLLWPIGLAVYRQGPDWMEAILNLAILLVALANSLVHAGDGWTGVMPWGIGLSGMTVGLMLISGTLRRMAAHPTPRI